jgi:hypothetical protein
MWKNESINFDDVLVEMDKNLKKSAFEQKTDRTQKRLQALKLLNKAAENFEKAGLTKEADAIVRIMEIAQTDRPIPKIAKKAEIESEIDIEEESSPEEDALYEELMRDPNIVEEVSVNENGDEEEFVPSAELLSNMW